MFSEKNSAVESPLQPISDPILKKNKVELWIKRDDLLSEGDHLAFCGNKWRKLKYNLIKARKDNVKTLLTFGGAYSNHIAAVASAGALFNFQTIGVIRGERINPLNPTLQFAESKGMELHFISRGEYRNKQNPSFLDHLKALFGPYYSIPEGGSNLLALRGAGELGEEILQAFDDNGPEYICVCCGTGGTLAGIITSCNSKSQPIGFAVLKGDFLVKDVQNLLHEYSNEPFSKNWSINNDYHFGGYAKFNTDLINFINWFAENKQIPLDPIYTGKMMFGIWELIRKGAFPSGSRIVAVHSGGLQGIAGFNQRFNDIIKKW